MVKNTNDHTDRKKYHDHENDFKQSDTDHNHDKHHDHHHENDLVQSEPEHDMNN